MEKEVPTSTIYNKHLLIDGDLIRYRCGFALENDEEFIFTDGAAAHEERARDFIDVTINSILRNCGTSRSEIWLSGSSNFREAIAKTLPYKANRKDKPKPAMYEYIGQYLVERYGALYSRGCEADDELGILLTANPTERVCVSFDKDMGQISGWHYDWVKGSARWISRKAGDFRLYTQVLAGDITDNVRGIRGIGNKKAQEILQGSRSSTELCQRAWNAYRDAGLSSDYFQEVANLVYILRRYDDRWKVPRGVELK
jgi:hypothetical protein